MKKLLLLFFAALCIIIASCSKDSGFGPGSDNDLAFSKGKPVNVLVIVVSSEQGRRKMMVIQMNLLAALTVPLNPVL